MRRAATMLVIAAAIAGCGQQSRGGSASAPVGAQNDSSPASLRAHPQAVEPVAGSAATPSEAQGGPSVVSVGGSTSGTAQPVSDAVIRRELRQSGLTAGSGRATLTAGGLALAPLDAPLAVQQIILAGNEIALLPYRFGGGHGSFVDTAYDCSGSLSYVFAAAGLLNTTVTSGQLMSWGDPGPGRWITVFAAPGHTFMYVAGLRFDTVALAETGSRWSNRPADENLSGFVERHPPGL